MKNRIEARQWFADNAQACIDAAIAGEFSVNDLDAYILSQTRRKQLALNGDFDHTFTFMQRAHYMETGECPALLP